ncbi:hypothetical protein AB751O23_AL_00110 [Chlamydiales bacterium SCGC AB-751-O23]|jgi:hypothetical protein|nr:hypothetical protein AB751O23_AL_00110 [Chlamydiales bacterium SCGC AB-751-O23]
MTIEIRKLMMTAFKGYPDPLGLSSYETYKTSDATDEANLALLKEEYNEILKQNVAPAVLEEKKKALNKAEMLLLRKRISPEFIGSFSIPEITIIFERQVSDEEVTQRINLEYKQYIESQSKEENPKAFFGPYGDIIQVTQILSGEQKIVTINQIANKSFPLPKEAADMSLAILGKRKTREGVLETCSYLPMITRQAPPGKNKLAFPGGFRDIKRDQNGIEYYQSALETARNELAEELKVDVVYPEVKDLGRDYSSKKLKGTITLRNAEQTFSLPCLTFNKGTIATGDALLPDGGEVVTGSGGKKRVHTTSAVVTLVQFPEHVNLTPSLVSSFLEAGSDAKTFVVRDITREFESLETQAPTQVASTFQAEEQMGITHHEKIAALAFETLKSHKLENEENC